VQYVVDFHQRAWAQVLDGLPMMQPLYLILIRNLILAKMMGRATFEVMGLNLAITYYQ